MNQPVFASSKFTAYFRKSAIFAFDHLQKQYKFYGQDNTRQYKTIQCTHIIMKLRFSVSHTTY